MEDVSVLVSTIKLAYILLNVGTNLRGLLTSKMHRYVKAKYVDMTLTIFLMI